jgi:hypothetical protein
MPGVFCCDRPPPDAPAPRGKGAADPASITLASFNTWACSNPCGAFLRGCSEWNTGRCQLKILPGAETKRA